MDKIDISGFKPCPSGLEWYRDFQGSSIDAWNSCPHAGWMLWIAFKLEVYESSLCLAMGRILNLAVHLMKDERSRHAVSLLLDYGTVHRNRYKIISYAREAYEAMQDAYKSEIVSSASYSAAAAVYYALALGCSSGNVSVAADCAYNSAAYVVKAAHDDCAAPFDLEAEKNTETMAVAICREVLTDEIKTKLNDN